jgi:hypothetical protein
VESDAARISATDASMVVDGKDEAGDRIVIAGEGATMSAGVGASDVTTGGLRWWLWMKGCFRG